MATQREDSRRNWTSTSTIQEINSGCLQRIADATEKMAENYDSLLRSNRYLREREEDLTKENRRLARRISALQGVITRQKNKVTI